MLPVGPKPILEHILDWLKANGVEEVVIATGYLGRIIEQYFEDGSSFGLKVEYARSDSPLGHAGQLKSAESLLTDTFICLYGDAILDFDLRRLVSFHAEKRSFLTMALMEYETKMKYGVIDTAPDGKITNWREKPVVTSTINVGCYVVDKRFLSYIPKGKIYGFKEAFMDASKDGRALYGLKLKGTFTDIGDLSSHKEADRLYIERYGKIP